MGVRTWIVASLGLALPVACVDLFHGTDFVTLCEADASSALCGADVGSDVAVPPLDFCAWTSTEAKAQALRSCAWLGACESPIGELAFGQCALKALWAYDCSLNPVMRPRGPTRDFWECLARADTCAKVDACAFGGEPPPCAAVSAGSFTACTDAGGPRVQCGRTEVGPPIGVEPCVLDGRQCATLSQSTAQCGGTKRAICTPGRRCDGTAVVDCVERQQRFVDEGLDCAAFGGGTCADDGEVACAPQEDAGSCDGGAAVTCQFGRIAKSCVDGREIKIDCAKVGLRCETDAPDLRAYTPFAACADTRSDAGACVTSDVCSGGVLRSCAHGGTFEIDCASVGLGPCEKLAGGVLARCTPPR